MIKFFEKEGKSRIDDMESSEDMVFDFFDFFDRTIDDLYAYSLNRLKDNALAEENIISVYFSLMKRRRFFWWNKTMNVSTLLLIADKQILSTGNNLTSMKKQIFDEASLESFLGTIDQEKLDNAKKAKIRTLLLEKYRESQLSSTRFIQATAGLTAAAACFLFVSAFMMDPLSVKSTSKQLAAAQILLTDGSEEGFDKDILVTMNRKDFKKAAEILPRSKKSFDSLVKELNELEEIFGGEEEVIASRDIIGTNKAFAKTIDTSKYDDKQETFEKSVSLLHKIREKAKDVKIEYVQLKIEYLQNRNNLISGLLGASLIDLEAGESALESGSRDNLTGFLNNMKSMSLDDNFGKIESTFGRTSQKLKVKLRDGKDSELASAEVVLENRFLGKELTDLRSANIEDQKTIIKTLAKERMGNASNVLKELPEGKFTKRINKFSTSVDTATTEQDLVVAIYDWYVLLEDIEKSHKKKSNIFVRLLSKPLLEDEKLITAAIGVLISERVKGYQNDLEELGEYLEMAVAKIALDDARALSLDLAAIAMEDQAEQKEMVNVILERFGASVLGD
jgi:hypothetical protein